MRIALLGPVHPYRGGIAHYTARLARALRDAGHEAEVVNLRRQYPAFLFPGSSQEDASGHAFREDGVRLLDSLDPRTWAATARHIRACRPDRLVVQWWHPFFAPPFGFVSAAVRSAGVQTVWLCHNVEPHESSPVDRVLLRLAYGTADRFIVQAESERGRLSALAGPRRVDVCPHPEYDLFRDTPAPDRATAREALGLRSSRVLLFFGLIRPYKGLDVLLRALPHVRTADVHLVVAGEPYEDAARYIDLIASLGLRDRVTTHFRYLANEEVPTFMAAADAVVLPYRHATQSGVAQVGAAFGVPTITTRVGGLPEVVHDGINGLLVPPEDPGALAAAIDRFYAPGVAESLAAGVRAGQASDGWARVVRAIEGDAPPSPP